MLFFCLFDDHSLPDNSNSGSTIAVSLRRDCLFVQPIEDKESVQETCLKSVIIILATPFNIYEISDKCF